VVGLEAMVVECGKCLVKMSTKDYRVASNRVFAVLLPVHVASYHQRHLPGDTEAKEAFSVQHIVGSTSSNRTVPHSICWLVHSASYLHRFGTGDGWRLEYRTGHISLFSQTGWQRVVVQLLAYVEGQKH